MSNSHPISASCIIASARGWLGTPYHDQASMRGVGCDCLGLLRGVWREVVGPEPLEITGPIPAYSRAWGELGGRDLLIDAAAACMAVGEIGPGAVVIFRMKRAAIAKHCGIITDAGQFIHSYEHLGVIEQPLTEPWRRRITASFEIPCGAKNRGAA